MELAIGTPLAPTLQNSPDLLLEGREVPLDCGPDFSQIDSEIIMHQDMAYLDDLGPRYLVMGFSKGGGKLTGSFTNDLNVVNHPRMDEFVFFECAPTPFGVSFYPLGGIENVVEALAVIPPRAMASLRTCLRTDGRSPRSEATSTGRLRRCSRSRMSAA